MGLEKEDEEDEYYDDTSTIPHTATERWKRVHRNPRIATPDVATETPLKTSKEAEEQEMEAEDSQEVQIDMIKDISTKVSLIHSGRRMAGKRFHEAIRKEFGEDTPELLKRSIRKEFALTPLETIEVFHAMNLSMRKQRILRSMLRWMMPNRNIFASENRCQQILKEMCQSFKVKPSEPIEFKDEKRKRSEGRRLPSGRSE
uniref:Uncharacterized protein n=1 Tax=Acrobeloides nanus TaxID=290746 RepID=A0A914D3Q4_9BILA